MRCSRCPATAGVRGYVLRWPRKVFLCRTHAAEVFKRRRKLHLGRLRADYGDMAAREAQAHAHHLALRADTLGRASTGAGPAGDLLDALAVTARRYWTEWDDQAHRAFDSGRARARAAGHELRAADRNAHALPVDIPWLRRAHRNRCVYCGGRVDHIDHVWPLRHGGDNAPWNLAPACARCNLSKGARSLRDWWPLHWASLPEFERVRVAALWASLRTA